MAEVQYSGHSQLPPLGKYYWPGIKGRRSCQHPGLLNCILAGAVNSAPAGELKTLEQFDRTVCCAAYSAALLVQDQPS